MPRSLYGDKHVGRAGEAQNTDEWADGTKLVEAFSDRVSKELLVAEHNVAGVGN